MAWMILRRVPVWLYEIPLVRMDAMPRAGLHNGCLAALPFGVERQNISRNYNGCTYRLDISKNNPSPVIFRTYCRRGDGFSELSSVMDYFDRRMRDMDRQFRRAFDDLDRLSPIRVPRFFSPWSRFLGRQVPVETSADGSQNYRLQLDLQDFKPEEIKVTIRDRVLTVEARKDDTGADGSRVLKEYSHQYHLPDEVITESVRSLLNADGTLTIEAPIATIEPPQPQEIPVQKEESGKENK